jgi:hypothetical protein
MGTSLTSSHQTEATIQRAHATRTSTPRTRIDKKFQRTAQKHGPEDAVVGVADWVVLRCRCRRRGGAALADGCLLSGRRGGGLDVATLNLDAAQTLPVAPL